MAADCAHPQQAFTARLTQARRPEVRAVHHHRRRQRRSRAQRDREGRQRRAACHRRHQQGAQAPPVAAVHHLHAAAGGLAQARLLHQPHHAPGAEAVRRRVAIGDEGQVGLISYMRTDSTHLAVDAIAELRDVIARDYGAHALPEQANVYKTKSKNAQEAHEAIRPTSAARTPDSVAPYLDRRRAQALRADLEAHRRLPDDPGHAQHRRRSDFAAGSEHASAPAAPPWSIPASSPCTRKARTPRPARTSRRRPQACRAMEGRPRAADRDPQPTSTSPSRRRASPKPALVKALEEYGIGRPSTYASIIQTLLVARVRVPRQPPLPAHRRRPRGQQLPDRAFHAATSTTTSPPSSRTSSTRCRAARRTGSR